MQDQELIEGGRDLFRPVLLLVAPQWWYGLRLKLLGAPASTVSRGVTSQLLHPLLQMVGPECMHVQDRNRRRFRASRMQDSILS